MSSCSASTADSVSEPRGSATPSPPPLGETGPDALPTIGQTADHNDEPVIELPARRSPPPKPRFDVSAWCEAPAVSADISDTAETDSDACRVFVAGREGPISMVFDGSTFQIKDGSSQCTSVVERVKHKIGETPRGIAVFVGQSSYRSVYPEGYQPDAWAHLLRESWHKSFYSRFARQLRSAWHSEVRAVTRSGRVVQRPDDTRAPSSEEQTSTFWEIPECQMVETASTQEGTSAQNDGGGHDPVELVGERPDSGSE